MPRDDVTTAIEAAVPRLLRRNGLFAKGGRLIEQAAGGSRVVAVLAATLPPRSLGSKMFGTTGQKLSGVAEDVRVNALVLTEHEVPRSSSWRDGADHERLRLSDIDVVRVDSARMATSLGAEVHLLHVGDRSGGGIVVQAKNRDWAERFIAAVEASSAAVG